MRKAFLFAAVAAIAVFSCTKEQDRENDTPVPQEEPGQEITEEPSETVVITAVTEAPGTKTTLAEDGGVYHVLWADGDQIKVNGYVETIATAGQPAGYGPGYDKAQFTGSNPIQNNVSPRYRAIYPSSATDQYFNFILPAEQPYVADGIAAFPMYAESDDLSFAFKNLCGIIQIKLKGEKSVSSISLADKGADPKPMSGRFNVVSDAAVPTSGTNGTALICATPVALNTSDFTSFFITVPAGEYGKLQIIIEASDGTICTLKSKSAVTVERSMITPISISNPTFKDETAQITYTTSNTSQVNKYAAGADASVFGDGLTVVSHEYDSGTKTGVITFSGTITSVGYYAFRSIGNIQTMTIPETVTSIGERAFESCSNLVSMNFPANLTTIGTYAFVNSTKFVPDDMSHITTIYAGAFQNTNLNGTFTIGNNFTRIDFDAFRNTKITEVIIDHTPETMGTGLFLDCSKLETVTLNDDIDIPGYTFKNCPLLATINFNANVPTIGIEAFNLCRALTSLILPSSLTSIGESAFANCSGIYTIDFSPNITFIGRGAFSQCTSLQELVLPAGLVTLSERENFSGCTSLTTVTFPANETFHTIPYLCFDGCTNLVSTSFPANITNINQSAFRNCGFTSLPEGWGRKTITYGSEPYRGCPIASITFPDDWTSVPNNFCWGWKSLQEVNFGTGVTSIGGSAFRDCTALTDGSKVVIPAQLASIGSYCFAGSGLTSLPAGINRTGISMDDHVFASSALTTVDVSNWTTIPQGCFQECGSLTSATLGSSLTSIKAYAFSSCPVFNSVTLPASLSEMGNYCFSGTALSDIPGGLHDCASFGENIFRGTPMTNITMPSGMTTIPTSMFNSCGSLTTVNLNDVVTVGNYAFSGCGLLSSVSAPNVVTVGEDAFYRNYALVSIELPSVVTVKGNAFTESTSLQTVDFGSHITTLGQDCFNNIQTMQAIYIRNGAAIVSLATRFTNYPAHPKPLIYVPQALLDSYKGNAAWSQYKDYFRGLDIPVTLSPITSMQYGDGSTPYYSVEGAINALCENGGTLTFLADNTTELTFTGTANGVIDMNGHTQNKVFWIQNTSGSITIRNGTFTQTSDCFDGKTGFADGYGGTVILENMTVNGILWTDSHPFIIRSGDYKELRNMKKNTVTSAGSGTITIEGGRFKSFYNYNYSGWTLGDYYISGGKFAFNPTTGTNVTIVSGYHVESNTDSDSSTYPYRVVAD
ncbi:MAG: leucine-rich repeat protein [Bacteroidales bacterium]|nr:leucine-rich repeat protein [Bacteroidales bacterium]